MEFSPYGFFIVFTLLYYMLTQKHLAEALGLNESYVSKLIGAGRLPRATHNYGMPQLGYTEQEIADIKAQYMATRGQKTPSLYVHTKEVYKALAISRIRFDTLVAKGILPPPTHQVKYRKKLYYSRDDIPAMLVALHSASWLMPKAAYTERLPQGYVLPKQVLERAGVSHTTLRHWSQKGVIPRATHCCPSVSSIRRYYTEAEADQIVNFLTGSKVPPGYVSAAEVADTLGKSRDWLWYNMKNNRIPRPSLRVGVSAYYTEVEAREILNTLGGKRPTIKFL